MCSGNGAAISKGFHRNLKPKVFKASCRTFPFAVQLIVISDWDFLAVDINVSARRAIFSKHLLAEFSLRDFDSSMASAWNLGCQSGKTHRSIMATAWRTWKITGMISWVTGPGNPFWALPSAAAAKRRDRNARNYILVFPFFIFLSYPPSLGF